MPLTLAIDELVADFPDFATAVVLAENLQITAERDPALEALIAEREAACRAHFAGTPLSEIPAINAWRDAYKAFGVKKTSYRSSVERLVKNVLADRRLPAINRFVDAYNAVSLAHLFPVGADDLAKTGEAVAFRYSRSDDSFIPLGKEAPDPPKAGEVVLAAGDHVLCRRWNWYQDGRSPISLQTRRALVTIQANGVGDLDAAAGDLMELLGRFSRARCRAAHVSADRPRVTFAD